MSLRSPFPDVTVPDASLFDFLFGDLGEAADRIAVVDGPSGRTTTYGQLRRRIEALAGALAALGVRPGDVVGILSPNSDHFVVVFHGILRAGATATTINSLATPHDITTQLTDAAATHLFTVSALLPAAGPAAAAAGLAADHVIVIDPHTEPADSGTADTNHADTSTVRRPGLPQLLAADLPAPLVAIDPAVDLAVLPYSSGTTSQAKGVMLTHRNLVANVAQSRPVIEVGRDDRVLCVLPFFHIYGMNVLMNLSLHARATLVTMPRFDLAAFLTTIAVQRVTYLFIAPPVAVALAKHPAVEAADLSTVRTVFSGAAPLDAELGQAVARRLHCIVRQGYGMSEMSPVSHAIPEERADIPLGTVGLPVPNMECRIVDPVTGADLSPPASGDSAPGELWCRGPNVMVGYLGDVESTAAMIDADGYLHTGDVATVSAEGYFTIVDRVKELIKYKGYQVPPAELEAVLLTHPVIADAAVIGVRREDGEEIPKAFVVTQPGAALTAEQVMAFVAGQVAPHKKVRDVQFVDVIPKSTSGKILRRQLRTP